jgi:hypothetical protein
MEITTDIPTKFRSGETIQFRVADIANYPQADGWALKYSISGQFGKILLAATFADSYWTVTLKASDNTFPPGDYLLYGFVTKGTGATEETYPIADASMLTITESLKNSQQTDVRNHPQKMLALINAALEAFAADGAINSASIAGRTYMRTDINQLYALRNKYARKVNGVFIPERIQLIDIGPHI